MTRHRRRDARAAAHAPAAKPAAPRIEGVDALRGIALAMMFVYHFSFDLRYYRVIAADFEHDPFWLGFRALIVASFMTLVGISLVLAANAGATRLHFWRRLGVIAACALAASVASWILFPRSYIYFGILHAIAVASVIAAPFVRKPGAPLARAPGALKWLGRHSLLVYMVHQPIFFAVLWVAFRR